MSQEYGYKTQRTKDGSETLAQPFYATNPLYVMVHDRWLWEKCPIQEARDWWALNWDEHRGDDDPRNRVNHHAGPQGVL